jgi:hypothetical protein
MRHRQIYPGFEENLISRRTLTSPYPLTDDFDLAAGRTQPPVHGVVASAQGPQQQPAGAVDIIDQLAGPA